MRSVIVVLSAVTFVACGNSERAATRTPSTGPQYRPNAGLVLSTAKPRPKVRPAAHDWSACPFPPESDKAKVDAAVVVLDIAVDEAGHVTAVDLLSDPGLGFGREAERCALKMQFVPARDEDGRPVPGRTGPLRVRFERPAPD